MATIKELAALAGVAPTTVTNVLRGRGRMLHETRDRVLAVVEREGYRPNLTARALVERRAPTLALMLSSITNPFYPEFSLHAHRAALRHNRFLLVCNSDHEADGGQQFLDEVTGSLSDGVLVANSHTLDMRPLRAIQSRGTPVVLCVWEFPSPSPGLPCVGFDAHEAGRLATEHLISLGHRKIGAIVGSKRGGIHGGRHDGYRTALQNAGITYDDARVVNCADTYASGYGCAQAFLGQPHDITALFVSNDFPALGVLNAASDLGIQIPRDLSVVGITDIELARQCRPTLTTVAIPTAAMATRGVEMLLELQETQPETSPMVCVSDLNLVARGSTAPPRGR